jgi:serine/threonine protein kinase
MKTTYNGTYTQVEELESSEGIFFLKQSLKDTALQDSFVRANFLSGARFLQTLKDPHLLTIDEVIETNGEVSISCKNEGYHQLGVYLSGCDHLKDEFLVELIKKMLRCLDSLHINSIYHQGLNPNSFVVNSKGNVKLTLFGTLEHRLYHHIPIVGNENISIQNAVRFYSPERIVNYGVINQLSEYYSLGLIMWYLKCVQINLSNHTDLLLNFPEFSFTASIWDKVLEACLQEDPKKRPKSSKEIFSLLPKIEKGNKFVSHNEDDDTSPENKVIVIFYNYNPFLHEIKVDDNGIEYYKYHVEDNRLIIHVGARSNLAIYSKKNGSLLDSFNSSKRWLYSLPAAIVEEPSDQAKIKPTKSPNLLIGFVLVFLLIITIIFINRKNNISEVATGEPITEPVIDSVGAEGGINIESKKLIGELFSTPSNLRSNANVKASIIEKCNILNEKVTILREKGKWFYVRRRNGTEGYIHRSQLRVRPAIARGK